MTENTLQYIPFVILRAKPEVSQKKQKRDFSYSTNAQNDKIIRTKEILCFFTKAKNDKIEEADDKSIKNCDDKVTESKNDKSNHNRDISPSSI